MNTSSPSLLDEMIRRVTQRPRPDCCEARVGVGTVPDRFLLPRELAARGQVVPGDGPVRWWAEDVEAGIRVELRAFAMPFEFSVQDYLDAWATRLAWQRLDRAPANRREAVEAWDLYRTARGNVRQVRARRNGNAVHLVGIEHRRSDAKAEEVATLAAMSFESDGSGVPVEPTSDQRLHSGAWGYSVPMVLRNVREAQDQPEAIALLSGSDVPNQTMGRAWRLENPEMWTGVVTARMEPSLGRSAEDWVADAVGRTVPLCEALEGAVIQSAPPDSGFHVSWAQSPGRRRGQAVWCAWLARVKGDRVFRTCMVSPSLNGDPIVWASNLWLWQQLGAGVFVEPPEVVADRLARGAAVRRSEMQEGQTAFLRRARASKPLGGPNPPAPVGDAGVDSTNTQRFRRPLPGESTPIPVRDESSGMQSQDTTTIIFPGDE